MIVSMRGRGVSDKKVLDFGPFGDNLGPFWDRNLLFVTTLWQEQEYLIYLNMLKVIIKLKEQGNYIYSSEGMDI